MMNKGRDRIELCLEGYNINIVVFGHCMFKVLQCTTYVCSIAMEIYSSFSVRICH